MWKFPWQIRVVPMLVLFVAVVTGAGFAYYYLTEIRADPKWPVWAKGPLEITTDLHQHALLSAERCGQCHAEEFEDWKDSHHALANRTIFAKPDPSLFPVGHTFNKDGESFEFALSGDQPTIIVKTRGKETQKYPVVGILAEYPLRQFLIPLENGKIQVTSVAWDVVREELFDVYGEETRLPGDWGHWMGQGMNWNANCAWCHMTDFRKRLNPDELAYKSTWLSHGISCVQCHPGSAAHVTSAESGGEVMPLTLDSTAMMQNCMSCHSRRDELTEHGYRAGASYHDHFHLSLPDQPGLYFADGQALDEVFAGASFQLSKMGQAGLNCLDCHAPHATRTLLPTDNNALCQSCHGPGLNEAVRIDPVVHSFHAPGTDGSRCIDCHMPTRNFMQRDPRRDHRFPVPDPLLTLELGVPNSCNQCHTDESPQWALDVVRGWYGEGYDERREHERQRARWFAAADDGEMNPSQLAELLEVESNPVWRASLAGRWLHAGTAQRLPAGLVSYFNEALQSENTLERERAFAVTARHAHTTQVTGMLESESAVSVRVAALKSNPELADSSPLLAADWERYLRANADRTMNTLALADLFLKKGETAKAINFALRAVELEPNSADSSRYAATLVHQAGESEQAEQLLRNTITENPGNADAVYALGLLLVETDRAEDALVQLRRVLQLNPDHPRAAYNYVLLLWQLDRRAEAMEAVQRALTRAAEHPDLLNLFNWMQSQQR